MQTISSTSGGSSFPWRSFWKIKAPLRVSFFFFFFFFFFWVWTATHGRILTSDNRRKRGVIVVEWCCMCRRSGESIDPLLLHCKVARELWNLIFTLFGVHWVLPAKVIQVLDCWRAQVGSRSVLDVWQMALLCLMWSI
jgi:hypothetical protein